MRLRARRAVLQEDLVSVWGDELSDPLLWRIPGSQAALSSDGSEAEVQL